VGTLAPFAGLFGGLAWLGALVLDRSDRGALAEGVEWLGLLLLLAATIAAGAGLVSRSARWLRTVVGLCCGVLAWSLLQLLADGVDDDRLTHAVLGVVAVVVASAVMARRPRGAHAR
jgi:hypothetical protein